MSDWSLWRNAIACQFPHRCRLLKKSTRTYPSRERKNAAVFANGLSWGKITITSLTEVTEVSTTIAYHKRKTVTLVVIKSFVCRAEIGSKHFDKLNPEPGRHEKLGLTYNSALKLFFAFYTRSYGENWLIFGKRLNELQQYFATINKQTNHNHPPSPSSRSWCL